MSEDFDIYADLDHIEKEARQESLELLTLRQHIKELEERVQAAEQEKTDIVRKNKILLENVSSLLLTAKAEIQRKDATISELRKQCDDAVFRRKFQTAKSAHCETRFTQTPPTLSVECCERLQSKCIIDDGRDSSRNRDREHDRVRTSKAVPERDRSHGRDRTSDREKERHRDQDRYRDRDQERNRHRDRDRCHDGDRERDRERYRERHRKSLYDRHHSPKERRSSERSRFKETHSERSRETKEPNPHEARTRDKERRSCEKPAPYRHGRIEDEDRCRSNPRLSDVKQGCLDIDRRTPEFHDGIKHDKLTNAGLNHAAEQMQEKSTDIKLQEIASNEVEQPSTSKAPFRRISTDHNKSTLTVDTNSKASDIQVSDDSRKQPSEGANSTANTNKLDKTKVMHNKSSKRKSKFEPADDVQSGAGKEEQRNELCQLKPTTNEQNTTTLTCERKVDRSKSSQDDTIPKHCMDKGHGIHHFDEGHQPEGSTSSTANKHTEPTALISATDTLVGSKIDRRSSAKESDDLVLKSTSLDKASSSSAEASAEDACSTLVDVKRDKGEARSSKDIHINAATNLGQDNNINALDDRKAKHNKSSKRKSKFEPADDVQCGAGKEEQRNELCQLKPTTNEQNPTKVHSSETSQHATIPKKATNEAHGIHLNQPQTSPFSTVIKQAEPTTLNALAGSKIDRRSSAKESDDLVLKSTNLDKASSSSAEASAEDACSTLVDLKRDKGEARSSKDIHINAATNLGQDNNINALDDRKAKHNKSSKRKSKFEPADDVQCGAGKEEQRNELCQLKPTTNEQNPTKVHSSETSQHATIPKKATNEAHGIHLNQPQTSPFSTVIKQAEPTTLNALAGSKTDRRSSAKESDDLVLKSTSLDKACSSSAEASAEDACSTLVDLKRDKGVKRSSKDIHLNAATNHGQDININALDDKKAKHNKSSKRKSKFEPAEDVQCGAGKEEQQNELCQRKPTTNEQNPTTITCERKVDKSKSSQDDTIPKRCMDKGHGIHHSDEGHQPEGSTSSTANKHAEPTALISATDTLVGSKTDRRSSAKESDDLVLKSTSLDKACSSSAEASAEDACSTLVDLKRDKGEARSSKDIHLNAATNHGQDDNINALDDRKAKHNKSSKRKSKFEPADDVQCGAGKEEQRNELCQLKPTTNEQNPTKVHSSETSQHATIPKKATNEAHGIHLNQPQTSPFATVIKQADPTTLNALAGSKTDRRSSGKESDDHVLKSMSFDASRISPGAGVGGAGNASSILAANNAPKPAFSVATKKGDPAHEAIVRNEKRRKDNLQTDGVSPSVSNETSRANSTSMIKDNDGAAATGTKLQQPSSISEATSLSESNSHCLNLCDKRSNSYSAVRASSGKQSPKSLKMSIQTYFMSFNERVDMDETSSCAALNESIELSVAAEVEIETSKPKESTGEASKKPKVSTAEAVRERLERKRVCSNVQKAALPSVLPMVSIYPKRKLSIDSVASVADKRQKLETAGLAHETKPSCETSPKLSSTYFSPITLSITSALDSIPSKLKSPDVKHSVWDSTLMTPMVVVHSPAKPSQDTSSQHVPNYYSSGPSDSSIQTIMESLFLTPIKNEAPDSVSPPSMAHARNSDEGNPPQSLTATNYGLGEISSTPLSSKPLARFCPDDDHTTYRVLHKVTARQANETNSTIARLEGKGSNDPASAGPRGNVPKSAGTRKPALQKSSKHAQLRSDKHSEHRVKAASHSDLKKPLQSLGKRLHTSPRNRCARSQRNENNNYHPSTVMRTDKTPNVVPNSVCDKKSANDTVTVQQQPNDASSSASISKMLAATEVVNSALVYDHHQANEKVKPFKQSSTQQRQKSVTNVEPVEKSNRNASSSKCLTEELPSVSAPSASNSTTVIPSKTSDEIRPTQNPATTRKRSRKQMNADDEKRHGSTKKQSVESYSKGGKKALCDNENTQPVAIRNCEEPIPQKTDPPRLAPTSKLAPVIDEQNVKRLNPQPLSAQPVERNCAESVPCSSRSIEEPPKVDLQRMVDTSIVVPCNRENNMERLSPQTHAEQLPATANTASAADAQVRGKGEVTSTCVVSNVTLNLSLADNTSNIHNNVRKSAAPPVQHLREMRIVKESPSLMRIFIVRK